MDWKLPLRQSLTTKLEAPPVNFLLLVFSLVFLLSFSIQVLQEWRTFDFDLLLKMKCENESGESWEWEWRYVKVILRVGVLGKDLVKLGLSVILNKNLIF